MDSLESLISSGRLPISARNVQRLSINQESEFSELVTRVSEGSDLIILGLSLKKMRRDGGRFLNSFDCAQDMLFVRAGQKILISTGETDEDLVEGLEETGSGEDVTKAEPAPDVQPADQDA